MSYHAQTYKLVPTDLAKIFSQFHQEGYKIVGPQVRDAAIVCDTLQDPSELPIGWGDEQSPGRYRLYKRPDQAYFGYTVSPQSWRRFFQSPREKLWSAKKIGRTFEISESIPPQQKLVLFGARACELAAVVIQDKVFLNGDFSDSYYAKRRESTFIIAVHCSVHAETCFCTSMKTGPRVNSPFDLALTEIIASNEHYFTLEVGSPLGHTFIEKLNPDHASSEEKHASVKTTDHVASSISRKLNTQGIHKLLIENQDSAIWQTVADRCLSCANCTLVCPTCFCSTVEDVTDLSGENAERWRQWDSCFTGEFTNVHGHSVRESTKSRYRHWLTHKLATWQDQFDSSGCTGCGRCISWCPTGIDLTEEIPKLRLETAHAENT